MPERPLRLLRANWVAPMGAPLLRDGALLIDGDRIAAVGDAARLAGDCAGAQLEDYGDAVILPGLVDAHVHLELTHRPPPPYLGSFTDWLTAVMASPSGPDVSGSAARDGIDECLRFGVTCVGDIAREPDAVRAVLADSPLAAVSYGEVVGMAGRSHVLGPRLSAATDAAGLGNCTRTRPGISPHAPYSVDAYGYTRCLHAARQAELPLTTHLAESPDEAAFLAEHAGPFRQLWQRIGAWSDPPPRFTGGPIRYAQSLGLLDYTPTLLAHVNYCDDDELEILAAGRAGVVYCPRTHAYFGHPPHRWREMLAAGINVCVGTDSRASAPDLNLVDDLRLLHRLAPEVPPQTLWEMATVHGARALGMSATAGALTPGRPADCVVFPAWGGDPLREVLETDSRPVAVWANGARVV